MPQMACSTKTFFSPGAPVLGDGDQHATDTVGSSGRASGRDVGSTPANTDQVIPTGIISSNSGVEPQDCKGT
jgi:hypothetical protein